MGALQIGSFGLTQEQSEQISPDGTQITFRVVYDTNPPEGWTIVAQGPTGNVTVCPKPCPNITFGAM